MNEQACNIVKHAHKVWEVWNELDANVRSKIICNWADEIAQDSIFGLMASKMAKYKVSQGLTVIGGEKLMPGPTGESNELYTAGRGIFIIHCSVDSPITALVGMVSTALLAGNCIVLSLPKSLQAVSDNIKSAFNRAGAPKLVVQSAPFQAIEELITNTTIAGVAYAGNQEEVISLNKKLANKEGLITQLVVDTELTSLDSITDKYFVLRFITEKTRTINVTAVGGNAVLLQLGCGD